MTDDTELLRRYAREGTEESFAELVRRHIDVVYAAALRQCGGNAAHAQDVTQLVFTDLARQSAKLARHPALLGWLHTAARFAAMKILRTESRRQAREQQAATLDAALAGSDAPFDWDRLQPMLDGVLGELKDRDRAAILLRFFEGKSLQEVGAGLQISETAARSCVDRALDKMRDRLAHRGLTSTSAVLGTVLAHQATAAAPAGLAVAIAGTAVASTAATETALVTVFTMKNIILGTAGLILVAEFATATMELKTKRTLDSDYYALQSATSRPAIPPSLSPHVAASTAAIPSNTTADEANELAQLRLGQLRRRLAELKARPPGIVDSQMRAATNVGRATPQDAMKTLAWALRTGDVEMIAHFVIYKDDTKENRDAFMANFSEATRARYQSPEQLIIAFSFADALRDPPVAQQIMESHTYYSGGQTVAAWTRYASGREEKSTLPFQETPEGWVLTALSLTGKNNGVDRALARIDPATGEVLPPKK